MLGQTFLLGSSVVGGASNMAFARTAARRTVRSQAEEAGITLVHVRHMAGYMCI